MDGKRLIKELQIIPKFIRDLEDDRQATLSLLSGSNRYSDTKVQTSKTNTQEVKTVAYLERSDYMLKHIADLHQERNRLLDIIHQIPNLQLVLVLLTIVNSETLTEAQDRLDMSKSTFFRLKREAMNELNSVLADIELDD